MANYTFTVNSTYNPFDVLNSAIARGDAMTKDMNDYQDAYAAIATQAATLQQRAEMENDSKWAQRYNDYRNKLNDSADLLLRQGLSPATRSLVNDAKTMYAADIVPIQEAVTRQNEEIARRLKAKPEERMQYGRLASIDDYIADPNYMNTLYSGSQIEKDAMEQAAALAKREVLDTYGRASDLGHYWLKHQKETGFSNIEMEQMLEEINERPGQTEFNKDPVGLLKYIYDNIRDKYGYREDLTLEPEQRAKLDKEIFSGIFKGLSLTVDSALQVDQPGLAMAQERARAASARTASGDDITTSGYNIRPVNLYGAGDKTDTEIILEHAAKDFDTDRNGNLVFGSDRKVALAKRLNNWDPKFGRTALFRIMDTPPAGSFDKKEGRKSASLFAPGYERMSDGKVLFYHPEVAMGILNEYKDKGYLTPEQFSDFQNKINNGFYKDKVLAGGDRDRFMKDLVKASEATVNLRKTEQELYNAYSGAGDIWSTGGISLPVDSNDTSILELLNQNTKNNGKLTVGGTYHSTTGRRDEKDEIEISSLWDKDNNKLKGKVIDVTVSPDSAGKPVMYLNVMHSGEVKHIELTNLTDVYRDKQFKDASEYVFAQTAALKKKLVLMKMNGATDDEIEEERQAHIRKAEQDIKYQRAKQDMIIHFMMSMQRLKSDSDTVQSNEY